MWRPDGWKNGIHECDDPDCTAKSRLFAEVNAYEAGADAMLEALKATGVRLVNGELVGMTEDESDRWIVDVEGRSGTVVFIPEER